MIKKVIFVLIVLSAMLLIVVKHNDVISDNVEKAEVNMFTPASGAKHSITDEEIKVMTATIPGFHK